MAEAHGTSVKKDTQYEELRGQGMNKSRVAAVANSEASPSEP